MAGGPLVCPRCARRQESDERLCSACAIPLVNPPADRVIAYTAERERARKVRREYTDGPLVRVAGGRNQAEAEFVAGLLLEEGIPSLTRRAAGFDVPDYLAAGPRDVLVPASGAEAARQVLLDADLQGTDPGSAGPNPWLVLTGLLLGLLVVVAVGWLGGLL